VLWVRSFWQSDWIDRLDTKKLQTSIGSSYGTLICSQIDWSSQPGGVVASHGWAYTVTPTFAPEQYRWVDWLNGQGSFRAAISHLFIVPFVIAIAAAPWFRWQFSLRALLIGMAAVAAILGLVIWAVK
jgi:hypothetical protein